MGIPLIFAAVILFAAAYQNQLGYLATNAEQDFAGFFPWLLAIAVIAAIGLIPKAKPVSYALLGLVFLVLFISNKGIFSQLQSITPTAPPPAPPTPGAAAKTPATVPGVVKSGSNDTAAPPSRGLVDGLGRVLNPFDPGNVNIFTGHPFKFLEDFKPFGF